MMPGAGPGWHPPLPDLPSDPDSYGNRLFRRIKELRVLGSTFVEAKEQAERELQDQKPERKVP